MSIAGNSDPLFAKLAAPIGRPELAQDPRFTGNRNRVQNVHELDRIIAAWTRTKPAVAAQRKSGVACGSRRLSQKSDTLTCA